MDALGSYGGSGYSLPSVGTAVGSKLTGYLDQRASARLEPHEDWSPLRKKMCYAVQYSCVDLGMAIILLLNVLLVIHETNLRAVKKEPEPWTIWSGRIMLIIYSVDIIARLFVWRAEYFLTTLNNVDICVVAADLITDIASDYVGNLPSFSLLRLLRLIRLMRVLRVLTAFKELYMMLYGLAGAMKAVAWASVLVVLVLCFWSIVSVELIHPLVQDLADQGAFGDCKRCPHAFESVSAALLTFVQTIIAGDSWGVMAIPIMEEYPASGVIFVSVMVTINFGMLNLVLSVIVDRAQDAREQDTARQALEKSTDFKKVRSQLMKIFTAMDEDADGKITEEELKGHFENDAEFRNAMKVMDVTERDIGVVFSILDTDGSGSVSYDEFAEEFHKMKTQDSHTLLVFMRYYLNDVWMKVNEELEILKKDLTQVRELETHDHVTVSAIARGMTRGLSGLNESEMHVYPEINPLLGHQQKSMGVVEENPVLEAAGEALFTKAPSMESKCTVRTNDGVSVLEGPQKYYDDELTERLAEIAAKIEQQVASLRILVSTGTREARVNLTGVPNTDSRSAKRSPCDIRGADFEAPLPPVVKDNQPVPIIGSLCDCQVRPGARSEQVQT